MGHVKKTVVGIDEVGRGPIAGPVAVGAFSISEAQRVKAIKILEGIKDSKKMSPKKREGWFEILNDAKEKGIVDFNVSFVSPSHIDTNGIVSSIQKALNSSLGSFDLYPSTTQVFLDGGLKASSKFTNQESIVRGEDVHVEIAAASVVAKVLRDRRMVVYGKKFPKYGFENHKGYGTMAHYEALGKHGPCEIHRKSFL